jgi:hypothetical protein
MAAQKNAVKQTEKEKAVAFVNWQVGNIRSSKGFALYDNQYATAEEKVLIALAEKHGGTVTIKAELRIVLNKEKPASYDLDSIEVIR